MGAATNTEDPIPENGTLLFVNITGLTDGRHRGASVQTKIDNMSCAILLKYAASYLEAAAPG